MRHVSVGCGVSQQSPSQLSWYCASEAVRLSKVRSWLGNPREDLNGAISDEMRKVKSSPEFEDLKLRSCKSKNLKKEGDHQIFYFDNFTLFLCFALGPRWTKCLIATTIVINPGAFTTSEYGTTSFSYNTVVLYKKLSQAGPRY